MRRCWSEEGLAFTVPPKVVIVFPVAQFAVRAEELEPFVGEAGRAVDRDVAFEVVRGGRHAQDQAVVAAGRIGRRLGPRQPGGREPGSEFGRYANFAGLSRLRAPATTGLARAAYSLPYPSG